MAMRARTIWRRLLGPGVGIFLLLIWALSAPSPAGATALPTVITQDTSLTVTGSPYTGNPTIEAGVTVTAQPGTRFQVGNMIVKGTLKAEGSVVAPVIFTGAKESAVGEWSRIKFEPGSGASVLSHVEVKYGGYLTSTGGVEINASSPAIVNSVFRKNKGAGINVSHGGSPEIAYNKFFENQGSGVSYTATTGESGEINIHDNLVEDCTSGISAIVLGSANVFGKSESGNIIRGTETTALQYRGPDIPTDVTHNILEENDRNYIALSGTVARSSTWIDGGVPIGLLGEVILPPGISLQLEPGLIFYGNKMLIKGVLKAEGTATEPIIFTSMSEDTPGQWQNIKFEPGSGASVLSHVEVKYGGYLTSTGGVEINASSPAIVNSVFRKNKGAGINVSHGGSPEIAYNKFFENQGSGVSYTATTGESGEINIHDNLVEGGGNGIYASVNGAASVTGKTLSGNTVVNTSATALLYSGPDIPGDITYNHTEGNVSDDIQVAGTVGHTATWKLGGSPVRFNGTVKIPAGIVLRIQSGVYIRRPQMSVFGTLLVEGTATRPVVLTGPNEAGGGEWGAINLEPGSGASVLNYVEVAFGGSGSAMLNVRGVSPSVRNSTFRRSGSDGIRVQQSGQPTIEGNRFRNNQFGLRYEGEGKLAAPRNDWGCADGPKPKGCGDAVSSNVEWQPAVILQELPKLCPGTVVLASALRCLLSRYEPTLQYDSEENFFADDVRGIAENWGDSAGLWGTSGVESYSNRLFDKDYETGQANGKLIGESRPEGEGEYRVTLDLVAALYPNSLPADSNDWLDENNNYLADSERLEASGFMHSVYGKGTTDSNGKRWLQYWYWYYYNPHNFAGVGNHEGDWESVLIGLDVNNRPDTVVLSQHESPVTCIPTEMEVTSEGAPIVFVGIGSHANFPRSGTYAAPFALDNDYADGNGEAVQPGLVNITDYPPGWTAWPGHWGNSDGTFEGEGTSPQGPMFHDASAPSIAYAESAGECERGFETEEVPVPHGDAASSIQSVSLEDQKPQVGYEVSGADGRGFWPRLRITVNDLDDGGLPGRSKTISNVKAHGKVNLPFQVEAGHVAEVLGSVVYRSGRRVHLYPRRVRSP